MPGRDIVVVGFSAGGIDPLMRLAADLPRDFPASIFVVHHFPPQSVSALPSILNRAGPLRASQAEDGERFEPSRIYVAGTDRHLLIGDGRTRLTNGPREHGHRPAIDPLFRSAARSCGTRVLGVILSGTLDDGTSGLLQIKQAEGLALVQDPGSAAYPGMPESAIEHVNVDYVVRPEALGPLLERLVHEQAPSTPSPARPDSPEPSLAGTAALRADNPPGELSGLVCPECGGVLWESKAGDLVHFRCHLAHAYRSESLLATQSDALEGALWAAVRALEEKARLSRQMAVLTRQRGLSRATTQYDAAAREAEHGSNMIRESLLRGPVRRAIESPAEPVQLEEAERAAGSGQR